MASLPQVYDDLLRFDVQRKLPPHLLERPWPAAVSLKVVVQAPKRLNYILVSCYPAQSKGPKEVRSSDRQPSG